MVRAANRQQATLLDAQRREATLQEALKNKLSVELHSAEVQEGTTTAEEEAVAQVRTKLDAERSIIQTAEHKMEQAQSSEASVKKFRIKLNKSIPQQAAAIRRLQQKMANALLAAESDQQVHT